jgi:fission process protein 1
LITINHHFFTLYPLLATIEVTMGIMAAAAVATSKEEPADDSKQIPTPLIPHNIFRDSALRYAGYANEIGESFRYQIPRLVVPTYVIAFTYVCADAVSTGHETWQKARTSNKQGTKNDTNSNSDSNSNSNTVWQDTIYATGDTLLWQTLASVVVPGAAINLVVKATRYAVHRSPLLLPVIMAKWLPTVIGIGSIPLIVQPIDHTIDYMLDNSTRHWWKGYCTSKK